MLGGDFAAMVAPFKMHSNEGAFCNSLPIHKSQSLPTLL